MRPVSIVIASCVLLAAVGACSGDSSTGPTTPDHVAITTAPVSVADCGNFVVAAERRTSGNSVVAGAAFTFASTDTAIVAVDPLGAATAEGPGAAAIVVSSTGALSDTLAVTVSAGTVTFSITPDTLTLTQGVATPIAMVTNDCHGDSVGAAVNFTARDAGMVSVAGGAVTGLSGGTTRLVGSLGAIKDSVWIKVSGTYAFKLQQTVANSDRFYSSAVSPQGFAYLTRPDANMLARFSLLTRTLTADAVSVGSTPTGVSVDASGSRAWVADQASQAVDQVDAGAASDLGNTPVGISPYWTTTSPNGAKVYVSGSGSKVVVLSGSSGAELDTVAVAADPFGLAVTPDGQSLFVGHLSSNLILKVNTTTDSASAFDSLGSSVNGMMVSPDGASLAVAAQNTDSLYFLSTSNGANVGQVALDQPWAVAYTPNGAEVWVTSLAGKIYRVNATTHALMDSLVVGGTPRGISMHPLGWGVVVANEDGHLHLLR